jgi:3-isopropylmalate/(R)-2-methylmalate dehydratase small subunit
MARVVACFGDDISTDFIYPGKFMATVLPSETPQFAFADEAELNGALRRGEVPAGSVIVAGRNFGSGSSREQAVSTLKGHGLVVAARSFARIFLQNAVNLGLRTITCPAIKADVGDELELSEESVVNLTRGEAFDIQPLPAARRAIVEAGGLIPYVRLRLPRSSR